MSSCVWSVVRSSERSSASNASRPVRRPGSGRTCCSPTGAALFGVASVGAFDSFVTERADTNVQVDVTRIASYVAAGIGFIGGGVIVKHQGNVRGMTTAASVWVAAAIGLSAGLGFWAGAISATLIALIALYALKPISHRLAARSEPGRLVVSLSPETPASTSDVATVIEACGPNPLRSVDVERPANDGEPIQIVLTFPEAPPDGHRRTRRRSSARDVR